MRRFFTKLSFMMYALLFMSFSVIAQKAITGKVTDAASGEAIIGANVLIKGTTTGTITDIDGMYSLSASEGDVLVISYTGYGEQSITVGSSGTYDIAMQAGRFLDEVVVVGYGSQRQKEVTSSVVSVSEKDFNKGPIADPTQLLQGKVAGLQIYNRGGDPNSNATIRLRGLSTVGANVQPLIVVDGVIGASLNNIDPSDIASMDVLKDGSAAAIYGSRGSSGVIIVTTKKGKAGGFKVSYNGQYGVSTKQRNIDIMTPQEFKAAGGIDLGQETDWIGAVTQAGNNMVHNLSAEGGSGNTSYRISGNVRNTDGILRNTGFDQFNTRANVTTKALKDKLTIDFNTSLTNRNQVFGFNDALRYAIMYNPTAPILGKDSKFPFNAPQFGGYFETLGLFDSFNPVSIIEQNENTGKRREFNYGANFNYALTDGLSLNLRVAQQDNSFAGRQYFPSTSLFNGNATSPTRKGQANYNNNDSRFKLLESYATYLTSFGKSNLTLTGGYSFQQNNFTSNGFSIGDFPDNSRNWADNVGVSQDLQNAGFIGTGSYVSPDEKIIAFFGRANLTFDDAIFVNASLRREGSTKLGPNNRWGFFPAAGIGVDLNKYLGIGALDVFKLRLGYGVTGALPGANGLSQPIRRVVNGGDGSVNTVLARAANPDLKWEEKGETNLGVELGAGRFSATLDLYNRNIKDFILERTVDVTVFTVDRRVENAGLLNTKGLELALNYDLIKGTKTNYTTGIVLSTYKTVLEDYVNDADIFGNLGAPGQNGTNMIRVKKGDPIGVIWGPVFTGVDDKGSTIFKDVNGDGKIVAGQDKWREPDADFEVLGNGLPTLELGWNNSIGVGGFNINAFFRGAFGHSLVNSFRAFYEPQISTQKSYNFMNTSKQAVGLTEARFSSLFVEKADFFKLDNLSISRNIPLAGKAVNNLTVSLTGQNLFILTGYTGSDPEPALLDTETQNPLAPGVDRRNNYFAARTFTLGLNFNF